ncbi:MAG: helix-turn-helix transcriptional regulator [Bordetella sp.]|nr:helix-turn-helix transcriptional regulator [Bordetella sp.]
MSRRSADPAADPAADPPSDADPDVAPAPVVGRTEIWQPTEQPPHVHRRHQLLCATRGVLHVMTAVGEWVLPSTRAIWISAGTEHATRVRRPCHTQVLYIDPAACDMPRETYCLVLGVSALMREVVHACAEARWDYPADSPEARLAAVLIDQVRAVPQSPVDLPFPTDARALRVAEILRREPANREPLAALAARAGASARTLERMFRAQAGMSFGAWRQRQRLLLALEQLAYGESVTNVALEVGYESASSFVAAFKAMFGTTPARYFRSA